MKRASVGTTALPLLTPVRRSGSGGSTRSEGVTHSPGGGISVRACVAPRRGTGMGRGAAAFSRAFHNAVKRGRGPVLRAAAIALLLLITAAYSSGRLGLDITADEFRLRFARAPSHVRHAFARIAYDAAAAAANQENDNDGDAPERDDDENDAGAAHRAHGDDANDALHEPPRPSLRRAVAISSERKDSPRKKAHSPRPHADARHGAPAHGGGTSVALGRFMFSAPRRLPEGRSRVLTTPEECAEWRKIATQPAKLQLYRRHFTSLDFTDWFLFVSMFTEQWHAKRHHSRHRPIYVDVAANHARRWSNTYFFDRCMGWDGVCAEANPVYHSELRSRRHCFLIDTCVSDMARVVNFSFTAAYGGVVRDDKGGWGVNGGEHATQDKYTGQFNGFHTLTCTTLGKELSKRNMNHVDFMSLDVEGYELPVLQGMDWGNTKVDILIVENKRPEIVNFLEEKGFQRVRLVLKDDIYIRKGSGYHVDVKFAEWLKHLSKADHRFHMPGVTS